MFDLNATLGLSSVEADPNNIPNGKYDGKILKSEYVLTKDQKVAHVITYTVTDGDYKGAQRQDWKNLGTDAKDDQGNPAQKIEDVASFTNTMSEQNKQWYKKYWLDLGINTDEVAAKPEMLNDKLVTFGIKRNDGYVNVNFVELRTAGSVTEMSAGAAPVSLGGDPGANPFAQSETPQSLPAF